MDFVNPNTTPHMQGGTMSENILGIQLGQSVPDFEVGIFDPTKSDFGEIKFADLKSQGKWTILFFYPADFTFV